MIVFVISHARKLWPQLLSLKALRFICTFEEETITSQMRFIAALILASVASLVMAETVAPPDPCKPPSIPEDACSYEALNGDCTVVINRFNPVTPPTIYVRRGKKVTVTVANPSPFEDLSLDIKSVTAQVPPDQFYNGFTSLTTALGSLEVIIPGAVVGAAAPHVAAPPPSSVQVILKEQAELKDDMSTANKTYVKAAYDVLPGLKMAEQPMPANICQLDSSQRAPYQDPATWRLRLHNGLSTAIDGLKSAGFSTRVKNIDKEIDLAVGAPSELATLHKNEAALQAAADAFDQLQLKLSALLVAVDKVPDPQPSATFFITDLQSTDKNNQVEVFSINDINKLAPAAKRVAADKYIDDDAALLGSLADVPVKQSVLIITAQYQSSPRFEISSGVLVPFTPYHSYTAAQTESASAPVVQETKTYTVVPVASFNILLGRELVAKRQRVAFFLTGAVGYTPATSSVAFAVGPSFSWRSIVLSPLADIGRDAQLAGGFVVGQPLGASTTPATAPLTSNVWAVKPAIGLSVRIPLGGATQ